MYVDTNYINFTQLYSVISTWVFLTHINKITDGKIPFCKERKIITRKIDLNISMVFKSNKNGCNL